MPLPPMGVAQMPVRPVLLLVFRACLLSEPGRMPELSDLPFDSLIASSNRSSLC